MGTLHFLLESGIGILIFPEQWDAGKMVEMDTPALAATS